MYVAVCSVQIVYLVNKYLYSLKMSNHSCIIVSKTEDFLSEMNSSCTSSSIILHSSMFNHIHMM